VRTPDALHRTDARAAAEVIVSRLKEEGIIRRGWRSNEIAAKIATTAENPDAKPYTPTPNGNRPPCGTFLARRQDCAFPARPMDKIYLHRSICRRFGGWSSARS
jgi:hypothetical protein